MHKDSSAAETVQLVRRDENELRNDRTLSMIGCMETPAKERVTVRLPANLKHTLAHMAQANGTSLSAAVTSVVEAWLRQERLGRLLHDYQAEHGKFDEQELRDLAAEIGLAYDGSGDACQLGMVVA